MNMKNNYNHYTGNITPANDTIFVFGSNPEGKHGAGSAKVALIKFGAVMGKGEGLYIPTLCPPLTFVIDAGRTSTSKPSLRASANYTIALGSPRTSSSR